jgi:L-ascorbate metabolism protein UlaG (beta-lactamase superfamily)
MKLTKYAHACVTLEKDGRTIVVDPGTFTPDAAIAIAGAEAVLVTHEHGDHVDPTVLSAALEALPGLRVYGPQAVVDTLGGHDGRVVAVEAGDHVEAAGFDVAVFGQTHAPIHPDIPALANVGYLVDGTLYHPGDAYVAPEVEIEVLLLPTSGAWTDTEEAVAFVRRVRPQRVIQIHELMLSALGQGYLARILDGLTGVPLERLQPGDTVTL